MNQMRPLDTSRSAPTRHDERLRDDARAWVVGPIADVAALRAACAEHALRTTVTPVADPPREWIVQDGVLRHANADFFTIGLYDIAPGERRLMMEQRETALVVLLTATVRGTPAVLLSFRTEPGLIGLTNLSTTIQSTPSNYLRRHGGKATPFIDVALSPHSFGTVLYDGEHHDWGDHYVAKTKRFLIVQLHQAVEPPQGYCWVAMATARRLLTEDHLVTNDLRVSLPLLFGPEHPDPSDVAGPPAAGPGRSPASLGYGQGGGDSRGTTVGFFRTETETREVAVWTQPLLVPGDSLEIKLAVSERRGRRIFAVERRTQPGLLGEELWFPVAAPGGRVIRRVMTCGEGGRFWRYRVGITLAGLDRPTAISAENAARVRWVTATELATLVRRSRRTALELRMAWSVAAADDADCP